MGRRQGNGGERPPAGSVGQPFQILKFETLYRTVAGKYRVTLGRLDLLTRPLWNGRSVATVTAKCLILGLVYFKKNYKI